ncbi:hypothetical protein ACFVJ4_02435 [Streptomyces sp. NPDC127178]
MRNAEARVTLGVTAAREGDLEQALIMDARALEGDRQSVPSLIMTSRELAAEMRRRYAAEPAAQELPQSTPHPGRGEARFPAAVTEHLLGVVVNWPSVWPDR